MDQPSLKDIPLFSGLDDAVLAGLSERAVVRSFPRNAVIINEGDNAESLFLLHSGKVKVFMSDAQGREVILAILGTGEHFGEMVLDEGPRSASVMTMEPSTFSVINRGAFREFVTQNPVVALAIIQALARRLRAADSKIADLALMDVYGRVARTLLDLAQEEDGRMVIAERPTQQALADMVGASREMISRILKDLRTGGYVREEGKALVIHRKPPAHW